MSSTVYNIQYTKDNNTIMEGYNGMLRKWTKILY